VEVPKIKRNQERMYNIGIVTVRYGYVYGSEDGGFSKERELEVVIKLPGSKSLEARIGYDTHEMSEEEIAISMAGSLWKIFEQRQFTPSWILRGCIRFSKYLTKRMGLIFMDTLVRGLSGTKDVRYESEIEEVENLTESLRRLGVGPELTTQAIVSSNGFEPEKVSKIVEKCYEELR